MKATLFEDHIHMVYNDLIGLYSTSLSRHISSNKLSMSLICCLIEQLVLVHVHESEICILSR